MPEDGGVAIESSANPRIKEAARLRERRARDATGLTLVDGGREALRALESGAIVETAFICPALIATTEARRIAEKLGQDVGPFGASIDVVEVGQRAFEKVAYGDRSDGIVLVVRVPRSALGDLELGPNPLVVVTEAVEKPGNVGAILRSADAAGASAIIAAGGTDLFNPNVIRASLGTVFSMPVAAAPADEILTWLRDRGLRIVATRVDGDRLHVDTDLTGPVAVVLGGEAEGLSDLWRGPGVQAVRLPMAGVADSLNVSVTAAVLLYEAWRQRRSGAARSA